MKRHTSRTPSLTVPASDNRDHIIGQPTAGLVVLEYGDFECPHCGAAHFILKDLLQHVDRSVRFAFRHFPQSTAHPHAQNAAEASEAAASQGKFWEMHDKLFDNQLALHDAALSQYAERLDLSMERFEFELYHHVYAPAVREDFLSGVASGVSGTPTFFINGVRHEGPYDLNSLRQAIDDAME